MKVDSSEEEVIDKKERKPLEQIIDKKPTKVKRSLFGRLAKGVLGEEGLPSIGAYVAEEIIVPAIKNIVYDSITSGLGRALFKDGKHGGHSYGRRGGSYKPNTNYSSQYRSGRPEPAEPRVVRSTRNAVEDYKIEDRNDATYILTSLVEHADKYDSVSVADYYDLIGVEAHQFTDNNHGWTYDTITRATILPVRGGYIIKFPPVEVI